VAALGTAEGKGCVVVVVGVVGGGEYVRQCRRRKQQIHVCQALPKLGQAIAQIRRRRRNVPSIKHDTIIHKPCSLVDMDLFAYEGDNSTWSLLTMSLAPFLLDYPALGRIDSPFRIK
jgi:hypothetical protein